MERRNFIAGTTGALVGAACPASIAAVNDAEAVRRAVESYYMVYFRVRDKAAYRLLTEDYFLLEHGEVLDTEGDIAVMPAAESSYTRTDAFDFRSTKIAGDTAYAVYFLDSDISDEKGTCHKKWLESVVLRRSGGDSGWRIAPLHSTRIEKPVG
jgi:ketosteroid isomerase-like protein